MTNVAELRVELSPEQLLDRVSDGDRRSFADLYDRFAPRVLAVIQRVLVDRSQSEEVTQEVFLEIWQTAKKYEIARGSASGWIMVMAHRRAIDRVRASQASRDRDLRIGIRDFADAYDDVQHVIELRLENERVKLALGRLTAFQREAIVLSYYAGLTNAEVSERLSIPIGTVKTRLRDGMIRLRDELEVAVGA